MQYLRQYRKRNFFSDMSKFVGKSKKQCYGKFQKSEMSILVDILKLDRQFVWNYMQVTGKFKIYSKSQLRQYFPKIMGDDGS